jgi:class 3 adenylate cyclase
MLDRLPTLPHGLRVPVEAERKGAAKSANEAATVIAPQEAAERRHVTVMFSHLVGSTALSARMDPEDLGEIISAYQKCVSAHADGQEAAVRQKRNSAFCR